MNITSARTAILAFAALSSAMASASAQSLFSQHGEVVHAIGEAMPPAAFGVTPAPGATVSATSNFDSPSIDQNGTILYRVRMAGGGASSGIDDRAFCLGRTNGDLLMVVRAGDPAPGLPGFLLRTATSGVLSNPPRISPYNEFLFFQSSLYDSVAGANPPATADTGLFWGPVGSMTCLAREGDPVGTLTGTGETWGPFLSSSELQYKHINSSGTVLFGGQLLGGTSTTADDGIIVTGSVGALSLVLREGEVFPGGSVAVPASGATQMSFTMQLNEAGQVLHAINFSTTLGSPPATAANDRALAIWTPGGGQSVIIAREGDQVAGMAPGVVFATGWAVNQGAACFTRSGKTAISSPISGTGITGGVNDNAVLVGGLAGWTVAMQKGDACPGLSGGELFGSVNNSSLTVTDAGEVAFFGSLTGPSVTTANDTSMWVGSAGNLKMLAREGDPCPGLPGYTFQAITSNPLLRDGGAVLANLGVTDGTTTKTVLFGYTPQLGMVVVIDQTETVTTIQGTGTISTLSSNAGFAGSDGGQTMFNNQGDFTFRPNLIGGSTACIIRGHLGSLIAKPSAVPVAGGVPQNFVIDGGPANANGLYLVLASGLGTRPGFGSPLGTQTIPLNPDLLWTILSINAANTSLWVNTLGFTDANGKGIGASSFVMPVGYPEFLGSTVHHSVLFFDGNLVSHYASEPSALKFY